MRVRWVTLVGLVFAFGAGGAVCYALRPQIGTAIYQVFPSAERDARIALTPDLIDPESLALRNVRRVGQIVCGEMNSRNRVGGYVGFRRFVVWRPGELSSVITPEEFEPENAGTRQVYQEMLEAHSDQGYVVEIPQDQQERLVSRRLRLYSDHEARAAIMEYTLLDRLWTLKCRTQS